MKELWLGKFILSDEEKEVCAGEWMNCLHKLKELRLPLVSFSPELESKLKTRGDELGCKVYFLNNQI